MGRYQITVKEMINEIRKELPLVFRRRDVVEKVHERFGKNVNERTIMAHVTALSDHPSSRYYGMKTNFFKFLGNGRFCNIEDYDKVKDQYGLDDIVIVEEDVESELETTFSFEKDLQEFISMNIGSIEDGLSLIDREYNTEIGKIDILAKDKQNNFVVIELKVGTAKREVLGQILSYMAAITQEKGTYDVRGIIIANDFDQGLKLAASQTPNIKLIKYRVRFDFEEVHF